MPAKSAKQYKFMQMMAHNPEKKKLKGIGPSPEVAKEIINKTPTEKRKQYSKSDKSTKDKILAIGHAYKSK